jgi:homoserine kinase type II
LFLSFLFNYLIMAVYTILSEQDVRQLLTQYNCGDYLNHEGITSGIENTNYYVNTHQINTTDGVIQRWVLTVFEVLTATQLPYYLELTTHLKMHNLPVSAPYRLNNGQLMATVHGKPAVLTPCLSGTDVMPPTPKQCALAGTLLANMHQASADFTLRQSNLRGLEWWQTTAPGLYAHVSPDIAGLLADEVAEQTAYAASSVYNQLPWGAVHADLFCNNVLIAPQGYAGAIDFFFAGDDRYVFDLCVTINDWCLQRDYDHNNTADTISSNGNLHPERLFAFMQAYLAQRPLSLIEQVSLPLMARAAALRFWISRLNDWYKPRAASQLIAHDPQHFERILRLRRTQPLMFNNAWITLKNGT